MAKLNEMAARYRQLTDTALQKVSIKAAASSPDFARAKAFVEMAENYFNDGKHFETQGKTAMALAAYSYAHAWLDAGVKAGFLDGKNDSRLFTLP